MNDFDFISALNSFNEKYLPKILIFLLVFVVGSLIVKLLLKLIRKIIDKSKIERTVITFFFSILKIVLYLIVVMTALSTIGVNVSSIITTFAAAAITAGLALQESLGNVASGVVILISKPFVAGDILEFEGIKGYVRSIRVFSTQIHTFDNKIVNIPNSRLTANNVTNCTGQTNRRINLSYTVGYDDARTCENREVISDDDTVGFSLSDTPSGGGRSGVAISLRIWSACLVGTCSFFS